MSEANVGLDRLVKQLESEQRDELQERRFKNVVVRTWLRPDRSRNWGFAPWLFSIQMDGEHERKFTGVPNYCETRHKALMRGWHRAKWLYSGQWHKHYTSAPGIPLPGVYIVINSAPRIAVTTHLHRPQDAYCV